MGGGLGDIEETLAAGRRLHRAGFRLFLYRGRSRPWPRSVQGPWDWPPVRRIHRLRPQGTAALTVTPAWGVSAAAARPGPYGRGGPWALEVAEIEAAYAPDRVLHISLEEFARTLPPPAEDRERFREGGVPARALGAATRRSRRTGELATFTQAFREFRAFDRPHVLHLFATFVPHAGFARAWPEGVQTGPLWSGRYRTGGRPSSRRSEWLWYASPASAERLAPRVLEGLQHLSRPPHLRVFSPRAWSYRLPARRAAFRVGPISARSWARDFAGAGVRIVTGSRTLLEAMELGRPFLYFNGVLGAGGRARRHRPEKLAALLVAAREAGVPSDVRRDLGNFGSGRKVPEVVRRVAESAGGWGRFPRRWRIRGFRPPFDDAGELVVRVARALGRPGARASAIVARVRARRDPLTRTVGR